MVKEDEDIVLEPTVGGKTTAEMRMSCSQRNIKNRPNEITGTLKQCNSEATVDAKEDAQSPWTLRV